MAAGKLPHQQIERTRGHRLPGFSGVDVDEETQDTVPSGRPRGERIHVQEIIAGPQPILRLTRCSYATATSPMLDSAGTSGHGTLLLVGDGRYLTRTL